MKTFEKLEKEAISNNSYAPLALDEHNNKSLDLLIDGVTAVVMERRGGTWVEVDRFTRETYFKGGYWSDVDIDRAVNGRFF